VEENPEKLNNLVDHLFRHESGKMVSVLTKMLGIKNLDLAQDIVQDTLLKAMTAWRYGNIPDNPPAWLYTVARNKAIDYLRVKNVPANLEHAESIGHATTEAEDLFLESEIQDSQLRMIFACCHPAIPEESQIALALKTLCGLGVHEIARAFLTSDDAIAKRIYRAKEKFQHDKIELEVPSASQLQPRIEIVLNVLYAMFNEGYNSSLRDEVIRKDICAEAMRLCHLLTQNTKTNTPATMALLALQCFQSSRFASRIDAGGNIVTLKYQDRSGWNSQLIKKGMDYLDQATAGDAYSIYHIEAAIASIHASSPAFDQTDWKSVYHLYDALYTMKPSPVVALNKAIASSYAVSHQSALDHLREIKGLEKHYLYHAALGEVSLALGKNQEAKTHFQKAIALTASKPEQHLLAKKLQECQDNFQ
jgi:RNA polymerase sigma factor (sigma-70 family)